MESLLEKANHIKSLLRSSENSRDFTNIAKVIGEDIEANIYVIGRRGKILGYYLWKDYYCGNMQEVIHYSQRFPESYNQELLSVTETQVNFDGDRADTQAQCFLSPIKCPLHERSVSILPVYGGGERLGTIALACASRNLNDEALVLAEYGAMLVGMEIMLLKTERAESDTQKKATVQIALSTLSFSERRAVEHIFSELEGLEGLLVASRIADRVGITRSVIVNALRKLESAGVIQTKSLGMKGTYIRILNENLLDEL